MYFFENSNDAQVYYKKYMFNQNKICYLNIKNRNVENIYKY